MWNIFLKFLKPPGSNDKNGVANLHTSCLQEDADVVCGWQFGISLSVFRALNQDFGDLKD